MKYLDKSFSVALNIDEERWAQIFGKRNKSDQETDTDEKALPREQRDVQSEKQS